LGQSGPWAGGGGPASGQRPGRRHRLGFLGGALALAFAGCLAAPGSAAAQDDYDRALDYFNRALEIRRGVVGPEGEFEQSELAAIKKELEALYTKWDRLSAERDAARRFAGGDDGA